MKLKKKDLTLISQMFLPVAKKNGRKRMILNLEQFNTHIAYHHFKKKSINNVLDTITTYVYMA